MQPPYRPPSGSNTPLQQATPPAPRLSQTQAGRPPLPAGSPHMRPIQPGQPVFQNAGMIRPPGQPGLSQSGSMEGMANQMSGMNLGSPSLGRPKRVYPSQQSLQSLGGSDPQMSKWIDPVLMLDGAATPPFVNGSLIL